MGEVAGPGPLVEAPPGVEAVRGRSATDSYLFLLNHTGAQVCVTARGRELIIGQETADEVTIGPRSVAVVRESRALR